MNISVHAIADYFILKVDREAGDHMTHLKLQKLIYYAQAWHLAMFDKALFNNKIEAWLHGPVCREIYERFRHRSWNPILATSIISASSAINDETRTFLDEVWEVYGQYSATKLEKMTHEEAPWLEARNGIQPDKPSQTLIDEKSMHDYYVMRMQARKRIRLN